MTTWDGLQLGQIEISPDQPVCLLQHRRCLLSLPFSVVLYVLVVLSIQVGDVLLKRCLDT